MCAGSTKIAAPIVILKIAAASPRMPMTRRSAGAWVGGAGEGEAMHQGMEKQVLRYARVPRATLRMTTLRACLQKGFRGRRNQSFRLLLLFFSPLSLKRRACHPER